MSRGLIFDTDTFAIHDGPGIRLAVYFKGCPLECAWCHSPESQKSDPELIFVADRCLTCGRCVAVCPEDAHTVSGGVHSLDRGICTTCGRCVEVCPTAALAIKGRFVEASEIADRAKRMKPFFDHSGGGITLTGGEITLQPEFAGDVLERCRAEGIHTTIETCGACTWETLEPLSSLSDLILYDVKLVDSAEHIRWTGADNRRIIDNLRRLPFSKVHIRVPLIPGITDTKANLAAVDRLGREMGIEQIEHLPYNESAAAKYEWLGRTFSVSSVG